MPLTCNIDARGKRARFINGAITMAIGIALAAFWALPTHSRLAWTIVIVLFLIGAFVLFEARAGWCALRAMGIKTRI